MPVFYNEKERVFRLDTPRTTCLLGLAERKDTGPVLGHIDYGPSIPDDNMQYLMRTEEWLCVPEIPLEGAREQAFFFDAFPFEYPAWGGGSFREPCLRVRTAEGGGNCELVYQSTGFSPASRLWPDWTRRRIIARRIPGRFAAARPGCRAECSSRQSRRTFTAC